MSKTAKIAIGVTVGLVIGGVCFYFFYWKPEQDKKKTTPPLAKPAPGAAIKTASPDLTEKNLA